MLQVYAFLASGEGKHCGRRRKPWRPGTNDPVNGAALGTLGFCLIFNLRKKYIAVSTVGGFLCWGIFLLLQGQGWSIFVSTLVTAVLVGMYGELFAYLLKVPTTILFTLACVPLIPGKNLYYSVLAYFLRLDCF